MNTTQQSRKIDQKNEHRVLVYIGIWFATLCWGSAYVAARFLLSPIDTHSVTLSPLVLATLRFSIASSFFLFPLARAIFRHEVTGRDVLLMIVVGQITFTLYYWLQYIGIQQTDAGISSLLAVGLIPVFTTFLAQFFGQERFTWTSLAAIGLGFLGVVFIVLPQSQGVQLRAGFLVGALCLIVNTFSFATYTVLSKDWMQTISPLVMTGGTMISGAIGLGVLSLLDPAQNQWNVVPHLNGGQWFAIGFLALGCSVLSYFAYNFALSQLAASRVTIYFYLEPLISVVLGVLLLGEHLTRPLLVGAFAIAASVGFVQWMKAKNESN